MIGSTKTGGRSKGTPNKRTILLDEILTENNLNVPQRIVDLLPRLDPKDQMTVLMGLMQYLYPKRKATEINVKQLASESEKDSEIDYNLLAVVHDVESMETDDPNVSAAHSLIAAHYRKSVS